ncbi:hypothetical protein BDR07DRAFT_1396167 [Suillus spraguei]|nr:hypothetical protein BDR07DRAFT_1396167 [Suillus spraguei]
MRLSILTVAVALTPSMFVSACSVLGETCTSSHDCCIIDGLVLVCNLVSMSRLMCNQDSTTMMTHLRALGWE